MSNEDIMRELALIREEQRAFQMVTMRLVIDIVTGYSQDQDRVRDHIVNLRKIAEDYAKDNVDKRFG